MNESSTARDQLDRALTVVRRSRRFWRPFVVVTGLGCLAAVVVAMVRPRVYKSETLMLYRDTLSSSDLGVGENGVDPGRKLGLKLKEMVLSRTRLQQIIDEYKLYPKLVSDQSYVEAVDEMRNHISFRVRDGDTFGLGFDGPNAVEVQQVTARLASALISENSRHRAEQAEGTRAFLDVEMKHSEETLSEKETELARFLAKHPEFDSEQQQGGNGLRIPKGGSVPRSTDATLMAMVREAQKVQERLGMPVTTLPKSRDLPVDPQLAAAKAEAEGDVRQAQHELSDKLSQFTEQHPDVRAAKAKVQSAEVKLRRANEAITQALAANPGPAEPAPLPTVSTADRPALEAQLQKINDQITAYRDKKRRDNKGDSAQPEGAGFIVALETDWSKLNREVNEARQQTQALQEREFRASLVENAATSTRGEQMVIIDPAFKPTQPQKPGRTVVAALGMAAALFLGLLVALGAALLDDRAYEAVDLERLALGPVLGVVPGTSRRAKEQEERARG